MCKQKINDMPDKLTIKTILYLHKKFERDGWVTKTEKNWEKYLSLHWENCKYAMWKAEILGEPINY